MHWMTSNRGFALLVSLILLMVLSLLGVAALNSSVQEVRIASNYEDSIQAVSWAEAGVEEARREIAVSADPEVSHLNCSTDETKGWLTVEGKTQAKYCVKHLKTEIDNSAQTTGSGSQSTMRTKIYYYKIDSKVLRDWTNDATVVKWAQSLEQIARLSM